MMNRIIEKIIIKFPKLIKILRQFIDLTKIKRYYCCSELIRFCMNFNGRRADKDEEYIAFCCEGLQYVPSTTLLTARESILSFAKLRSDIIAESKIFSLCNNKIPDNYRIFTKGCIKCHKFKIDDFDVKKDNLIHFVNINMFFAPCQCKCVYCTQHEIDKSILQERLNPKTFIKVIEAIDYAKNNGMIAEDALWQVASGEITIHPLRDKILDLIDDKKAKFLTNGFIFDERIASNLNKNHESNVNISIDSGTPETWYKVKGVNNFNEVVNNITKYSKSTNNQYGGITFKYIILPGMNDNINDYYGVIKIMKDLKLLKIRISRDSRYKYSMENENRKILIKSAGILVGLLKKNNLENDMVHYLPEEIEEINIIAEEYLNKNI